MHWISLVGFLLIIGTYQAQSSSSSNNFGGGDSKGISHVVSGGNGGDASGSHDGATGSAQFSSGNVPSGSFMKHDDHGHNTMKYGNDRIKSDYNSGTYNQCSVILPFFIAAFVAMMYF
jgi:hypothetical protein